MYDLPHTTQESRAAPCAVPPFRRHTVDRGKVTGQCQRPSRRATRLLDRGPAGRVAPGGAATPHHARVRFRERPWESRHGPPTRRRAQLQHSALCPQPGSGSSRPAPRRRASRRTATSSAADRWINNEEAPADTSVRETSSPTLSRDSTLASVLVRSRYQPRSANRTGAASSSTLMPWSKIGPRTLRTPWTARAAPPPPFAPAQVTNRFFGRTNHKDRRRLQLTLMRCSTVAVALLLVGRRSPPNCSQDPRPLAGRTTLGRQAYIVSTDGTHEAQTCPICGGRFRGHPGQQAAVSGKSKRPTEAECWRTFWQHLAAIWPGLPPKVQQRCLDRVVEREAVERKCSNGG